MSTQADLTASAALANEMAAAHEAAFPRARISMLEPTEQVARGVDALAEARISAMPPDEIQSFEQRQEIRIKVLADAWPPGRTRRWRLRYSIGAREISHAAYIFPLAPAKSGTGGPDQDQSHGTVKAIPPE